MADPRQRLQIVEELPDPTHQVEKPDSLVSVGATALMLGLKALSQRAIAAIDTWFMLLTVGSVWVLWWNIPNPSVTQIVALSIFAVFVLAANIIVRKF